MLPIAVRVYRRNHKLRQDAYSVKNVRNLAKKKLDAHVIYRDPDDYLFLLTFLPKCIIRLL